MVFGILLPERSKAFPSTDTETGSTMHVIETEIRNYLILYNQATRIICLGISEELLLEYMLVDNPAIISGTIHTKYKDLKQCLNL